MSDPPVDPTDPDADLAPGGGGEANPFAGGFDMGSLLESAMEMQQQLLDAQATAAEAVVEGHAGGGAVKIRVTGAMVFEAVEISPDAVDPDDVEMLQDLVLAALNDALDQIAQLQQASVGGFDMGALGGALGIGGSPTLGLGSADDEDEDDEDDEDDEGPGAGAR
jgi:nucleoid-associated protein EbfC